MDQVIEKTLSERANPLAEVLFVDLDGCLVSTDLLWELLFALLRRRPWCILLVPIWLLRGRAALKAEVARRADLSPDELPYNATLLELLRTRRAAGARLVLATASPRAWAEAVATHLGLFDEVLASDPTRNLKGRKKLESILENCRRHGVPHFTYVGDCEADLAIWRECRTAYVVAPSSRLSRRLRALDPGVAVHPIGISRLPWRAVLRAMRPHQWAKNVLIFVPLVTGQQLFNLPKMLAAILATVAFSLCASAIYVINDLVDLAVDRATRKSAGGRLPAASCR